VIFDMLSDRLSYSFDRCSSKIELSLQKLLEILAVVNCY
jgi:hypothetical protein